MSDTAKPLSAMSESDPRSAADLLPLVYDELRKLAHHRMGLERGDHTLDATALVHEAYVRLVGDSEIEWANRAHFFHAASEAMRRILIEHARARGGPRRGGGRGKQQLDAVRGVADLAEKSSPEEIMALDEAVSRLESDDAQAAAVVRLRFYAGLSVEETAGVLQISSRTVKREWSFARAYLFRKLDET